MRIRKIIVGRIDKQTFLDEIDDDIREHGVLVEVGNERDCLFLLIHSIGCFELSLQLIHLRLHLYHSVSASMTTMTKLILLLESRKANENNLEIELINNF